jgi:hypothetical protein
MTLLMEWQDTMLKRQALAIQDIYVPVKRRRGY